MSFATMHEVLSAGAGLLTPAVFAGQEFQSLVSSALEESHKWHRRHCALQAPFVLTSVIAMSLYRSSSIENVFKRVLDSVRGDEEVSLHDITPEAFYHARARLGAEPLRLVATSLANNVVPAPSFLGLIPCAMDGVKMDLPDTPANEAEFGRPPASRGETAFPQMTGVGLVYTDTHHVRDFVWGRWNLSELSAAETLAMRLGPKDVVFLDRRYTKVDLWYKFLDRDVHFIHRLSGSYKQKPIKRLGVGDWLIEVGRWVPAEDQPKKTRTGRILRNRKRRWVSRVLRLIVYQIGEHEQISLITDLVDPVQYPAREIALGYHLRWEIELVNDETKTHLSTVNHGTQHTTFRSKKPHGIYQEAWAMVAAYNLVRGLIVEAGKAHDIPPLEISFVDALEVIRMAWPRLEACSGRKRKNLYRRMIADLAGCRMDRPRRKRSCPRRVRRKMSKFHVKRKGDQSTFRDFAAELKLVDSELAA